jgi:hypothetical protein
LSSRLPLFLCFTTPFTTYGCTAELNSNADGKSDDGRDEDGVFPTPRIKSILRLGRVLPKSHVSCLSSVCPLPRLRTTTRRQHGITLLSPVGQANSGQGTTSGSMGPGVEGSPHCRQGTEHYCHDNSSRVAQTDGKGGQVVREAWVVMTSGDNSRWTGQDNLGRSRR